MDIPSFLRMYPSFDELDDERLEEVVRHTQIEFFPAGMVIQHQSGEPSGFLYMVGTGAVEAVDGDLVADVLGEGEFFGFVSLFTGLGPAFTLRALEDTICYLIDQEVARKLMATRRGLAFLAGSLRRREVSMLEGPEREATDPWAAPVSTLATASRHGVPVGNAHHALDDALVTVQLFLVVATRLARHGYKTVRSLLRAARPVFPSRLIRFPGR